jgi:hypothetical protein
MNKDVYESIHVAFYLATVFTSMVYEFDHMKKLLAGQPATGKTTKCGCAEKKIHM